MTAEVQRVAEDAESLGLAHHQYHKSPRLHGTLRPFGRLLCRDLLKFSRWEKDLLGLRIERHSLRARLCLDRSGVLVFVRGLLLVDIQSSVGAREENQTGSRIKLGKVDAGPDRKAGDDLPRGGVHHDHLRLVAAADE